MKKWLKRISAGLLVSGLGLWAIGAWLLRSWTAQPPPLPADTGIMRLATVEREGRTWLGQSWVTRREGLVVVFLKGTPFEIGYANGVLLRKQMHTLEDEFIVMVRGYVPSEWTQRVLKWYVLYRNRNLTEHVPLEYRMEIFGATVACPDLHPEIGPYYNRMLNYHAAHDVSYMLIDNPLVSRAGCTAFGAWGGGTEQGHLITGRNFDWEAAEVFSRDRVVQMWEPENGIPFISLSWAGMAGVVSGMNRAGVSVSVNGAPSGLPEDTATPVAIVAREVLQHAHNLAETLAILRRARVFVSTIWLVGSRADGRFVVVEKTPHTTEVREADGDSIICANHFQSAGMREDPRNRSQILEATSVSRHARMEELLRQGRGRITPGRAAGMLRDRALPGGLFPGNGHRAALNALIATHSTVMDLSEGVFWAASPPHQLGRFVAFDVKDFARELPGLAVPPDAMLDSGEFERFRQAQQCLAQGQLALRKKEPETALALAARAELLNPALYQNAALRGRALLALGRQAEAIDALTAALAGRPAFLAEKTELEELLRKARGGK